MERATRGRARAEESLTMGNTARVAMGSPVVSIAGSDDAGAVVVTLDVFQMGEHTRMNQGMAAKVAELTQSALVAGARDGHDRRPRCKQDSRGAGAHKSSAHDGDAWRTPNRRARNGRASTASTARSDARTRGADAAWSRRAPSTLMGLCNRISTPNFSAIADKVAGAVEKAGCERARECVETIMNCLGASDTYVGVYAKLLCRVRNVAGVHAAIAEYASDFVQEMPFCMPCAPHPSADYDAFCAATREKRRRANATEAIAALGFGDLVAERARDALQVVADPHSKYDKDLAVRFLSVAVRASANSDVDAADVARIATRAAHHGIDARTRFQLNDLVNSMAQRKHPSRAA